MMTRSNDYKSGLLITCKKRSLAIFLTDNPYCIIDRQDSKGLKWNDAVFIPLDHRVKHKISIQFPYMEYERGVVEFDVSLKKNEIAHYQYLHPIDPDSEGNLTFIESRSYHKNFKNILAEDINVEERLKEASTKKVYKYVLIWFLVALIGVGLFFLFTILIKYFFS